MIQFDDRWGLRLWRLDRVASSSGGKAEGLRVCWQKLEGNMWTVMTVLLGDPMSCIELWVCGIFWVIFCWKVIFWSQPKLPKKVVWNGETVEARIWPSDSESWFGLFAVALLIGLDHGNNLTPAKGSAGVMGDGDLWSQKLGGWVGWFIEVPNFYPYWDLPNL